LSVVRGEFSALSSIRGAALDSTDFSLSVANAVSVTVDIYVFGDILD